MFMHTLKKSIVIMCAVFTVTAYSEELPAFLRAKEYQVVFPRGINAWKLKEHKADPADNDFRLRWANPSGHEITLKYRYANSATIEQAYLTVVDELDRAFRKNSGRLLKTDEYFALVLMDDSTSSRSVNTIYAAAEGVYSWKYKTPANNQAAHDLFIDKISFAARKHQYESASKLGNISMDRWSNPVYEFAKLLAEDNDPRTEAVYTHLLQTNPSNYQAHTEYISIAKDKEKRAYSAKIVLNNAEKADSLTKAARFLGKDIPSMDSYPRISTKDKGLKVVLIPLSPCNVWLLEEVADAYESITSIPVVIRKPPLGWTTPQPSRSAYRPALEKMAAAIWPGKVDFVEWPLEKLKEEILKKARKEGGSAVAYVEHLYKKMEEEGNQWNADPILEWLMAKIRPLYSEDPRTMVVALTELDIYSGETRFVFSVHARSIGSTGGVLSYARMRGEFFGEGQSRKRLVERIAKELVPASLTQLGIPRSIDPTCPYSYSSGLERCDQKTMTLSERVKKAIDRMRKGK